MKKLFFILLISAMAINVSANSKLYHEMGLEGVMPYELFERGIVGYEKIEKSSQIITFIDFSRPSVEKRLFVLNLQTKKLLFNTYVSHGRNSGTNYASYFSNEVGSYKSSLGFFLTKGTYQGRNGYSLRLSGLEKGINDRAEERAIVIHGASYANEDMIKRNGRLGRSLGCPALPTGISREIIDTIKNGSVLFIYSNNDDYFKKSQIVQETVS